ncbi:hypothetical protein L218DRAFT_998774 [Marasmius fiardii PR-910]|nr:hypothetical protein L218DRAFT_998774 [Marasmius fiardii PR-910]
MTKLFARASLTAIQISLSKAFDINALPATVTQNQVVTLTWFREQVDPTYFQLGKVPHIINGNQDVGLILPKQSVERQQTRGVVQVTFLHSGVQLTIAAYDLSKVSGGVLPEPVAEESHFFIDSQSVFILDTSQITPIQTPSTLVSSQNTDQGGTTTSFQGSNVSPPATITSNHPSPTSGVASTSTDSLTSISISGATETSRKPDVGAIVGSIAGGLVVLAVFIIVLLKQRSKRHKRTSDSTSFLTSSRLSGTTTSTVNSIQKNGAMVQQREQPAQLEAHEHASQGSGTGDRIMNGTSGPNEGDDTVQILRYEVDVLKRRIAALERESTPPDYSSRVGTA